MSDRTRSEADVSSTTDRSRRPSELAERLVEAAAKAIDESTTEWLARPGEEWHTFDPLSLNARAAVVAVLETLADGIGLDYLNGGDLQDMADHLRNASSSTSD